MLATLSSSCRLRVVGFIVGSKPVGPVVGSLSWPCCEFEPWDHQIFCGSVILHLSHYDQ
jgi:hypothetical protein